MEWLKGHLLIAIPQMGDGNFSRSVVLLFQHDEQGASGVILNRPSKIGVREVWEQVSDVPCDSDQPVFFGGPVEGPPMAIHTSLACGEIDIVPGVYLSISHDQIESVVEHENCVYQIYSGYAGWAPGQLENEIALGGWLTTEATYEHIFEPPEDLWKQACEEIGRDVVLPGVDSTQMPGDPSIN